MFLDYWYVKWQREGASAAEVFHTHRVLSSALHQAERWGFIDHANARLSEPERDRYAALGLLAGPFNSVAIYAPPRRGDPNAGSDVATRAEGLETYYWTIAEFAT